MKTMSSNPAGGSLHSRLLGTQVVLAGRSALLPNDDVPIIVQKMTMGQINAIPTDRFAVSLVEATGTGPSFRLKGPMERYRLRQMKRHGLLNGGIRTTGLVRRLSGSVAPGDDGSRQYTTLIALAKEVIHNADDLYFINRRLIRDSGGEPPGSDLFLPPIDAGLMSDCIKKIVLNIFGYGDKGEVCGGKIKLVEFCLLMHYYFIRIKILNNTSRQPFCEYLEKFVFTGQKRFTAKTFNNNANSVNYSKMEPLFIDEARMSFNFKNHPNPDGTLKAVFQEVGCIFHNSPYFNKIREIRTNVDNFRF